MPAASGRPPTTAHSGAHTSAPSCAHETRAPPPSASRRPRRGSEPPWTPSPTARTRSPRERPSCRAASRACSTRSSASGSSRSTRVSRAPGSARARGGPLGLVSDEVRAQSSRGGDAARELGAGIGQLAAELTQLESHVGQAQVVVAEVTQDSARAAGAASDAESALIDMGERVKKATGSDPEAVRAIAEASERARALVASLAALSGKVPRDHAPQRAAAGHRAAGEAARAKRSGRASRSASDDAPIRSSRGCSFRSSSAISCRSRASPRDDTEAQRAIHALKGSAGLAGERELAADARAAQPAHPRGRRARVRRGRGGRAHRRRASARRRVRGRGALARSARRPRRAPARSARARAVRRGGHRPARRASTTRSRPSEDPIEAARALYRHVHTMKGAGSSVGDEPMSWFCHGLEERLRVADSKETARTAMQEVAQWRVVLGALLDEPDTALDTLRARRRPSQTPLKALLERSRHGRSTRIRPASPGFDEATATIRVPAVDIDRLLERLDVIERARERIATRVERGHRAAALDAPAPFGASSRPSASSARRGPGGRRPPRSGASKSSPARSGAFGEELDAASSRLNTVEHVLRDGVTDAKKQLSAMRQTTVGPDVRSADDRHRVRGAPRRLRGDRADARRGRDDRPAHRRAAHRAVPAARSQRRRPRDRASRGAHRRSASRRAGRSPSRARKIGNRLSLTIEDDGAGVDVGDVRARGGRRGPRHARDRRRGRRRHAALAPVSSRASRPASRAICWRGAGIGLEIARSGVQRMGGAIRLSSRAGRGVQRAHRRADRQRARDGALGRGGQGGVRASGRERAAGAAERRRGRRPPSAPHRRASTARRPSRPRYAIDLELQGDTDPGPARSVGRRRGRAGRGAPRAAARSAGGGARARSRASSCEATGRCASRSTPGPSPRGRARSRPRPGRAAPCAPASSRG